jgi:hypothetical protein
MTQVRALKKPGNVGEFDHCRRVGAGERRDWERRADGGSRQFLRESHLETWSDAAIEKGFGRGWRIAHHVSCFAWFHQSLQVALRGFGVLG